MDVYQVAEVVQIVKWYFSGRSLRAIKTIFNEKFPIRPSTLSTICRIVKNFKEHGGTHRPLWAVYGEYNFLPRQRWIHNLEHGAVVMLYHPCANKHDVNTLKQLVKGCLYRHVITPYNFLSTERPLALVTWGHRLEMSKVAPELVVEFVRLHALKGPEQTHKDGQYTLELKEHAEVVSTIDDTNLCPKDVNINMK